MRVIVRLVPRHNERCAQVHVKKARRLCTSLCMLRRDAILERGVWHFKGGKPVVHADVLASARCTWRAWSLPWLSRHATSCWDYVLVHSDVPFHFYAHLYAIKPHCFTAHACLELHTSTKLELHNVSGTDMPWHLHATGIERGCKVKWLIHLCADEKQARLCYRVLQNCVQRLSRLVYETQCGETTRLYKDARHSPYKGQAEWLLHSDRPVLIESSPRHASRLPPLQMPVSPTWTPRALSRSIEPLTPPLRFA